MGNLINYSAQNRCPICGHPDWCGKKPPYEDGTQHLICMRHLDGDNVHGKDGQSYVFDGFTESGNARYMEYSMYQRRHAKRWTEEEADSLLPCPICGDTKGNCRILINNETKDTYYLCSKVRTQKNVKRGDKWYVYEKEVKNDCFSRYEESNARKARLRKWKEQQGQQGQGNPSKDKMTFNEVKDKKITSEKESVAVKDKESLDKIYRFMLDSLVLEPVHRAYLKQEGWTDELIERWSIRSFPESDYMREKFQNFSYNPTRKELARKVLNRFGEDALIGVPGAYQNKSGEWTFSGRKGLLLPLPSVDGRFYRLRVRMDFMDVNAKITYGPNGTMYYEENGCKRFIHPFKGVYTQQNGERIYEKVTGGKYRNFSSYKLDENGNNIYPNGTEAGNNIGFYSTNKDSMFLCFLTEGEKKGAFCNDKMGVPFISFPGVNSWSKLLEGEKGNRPIDLLKQQNITMFVVAYDADVASNNAVFRQQYNVTKALRNEGFEVGVACWDVNLGKGLDDLLASGNKPFYDIVDDAYMELCEKEWEERKNS